MRAHPVSSVFEPQLHEFLGTLPGGPATKATWNPVYQADNEGLTIPAQVNYVGKGANLYDLGYQHHGSITLERASTEGGGYS